MGEIDLSVLVTFYNQENYVDDALNSIFNQQTKYKYEVLIADDGSSDNTVKKINEWIKKHPGQIKLFIMPRDKTKKYSSIMRASNARNYIYQRALGDYVCFLDGDDFFYGVDKFEEQINKMKEDRTDVCGSSFIYYKNENEHSALYKMHIKDHIYGTKFWSFFYVHVSAFIFRRKDIQYDVNNFDDNTIIFPFLDKSKISFIDTNTFAYRQHEDSSWNSSSDLKKVFTNLNDYYFEITTKPSYKKASFKRHIGEFIQLYKQRKNTKGVEVQYDNLYNIKFVNRVLHYDCCSMFAKAYLFVKYLCFKIDKLFIRLERKLSY